MRPAKGGRLPALARETAEQFRQAPQIDVSRGGKLAFEDSRRLLAISVTREAGSDQGIGHLAGVLLKLSPSQGFGAADHGDAVGGEPGMVRDDVWIEVIVREFQRHGTASSRL